MAKKINAGSARICPKIKEPCHYCNCTDKVCQRKDVVPLNWKASAGPNLSGRAPAPVKTKGKK